jgi:hypothetical protein
VRERACKWKLDVKTCQFGSALVFARSCLRLCKRGTATKAEHLPEKSVINMIWLLFPVSDWPIIWIARGGFLWIVSYPLKSQFQFYGPGWIGNKSKELNLDVRNVSQIHILSTNGAVQKLNFWLIINWNAFALPVNTRIIHQVDNVIHRPPPSTDGETPSSYWLILHYSKGCL